MWIVKDEKNEVMSISEAIDKWLSNSNYVFVQIFDNRISFLCVPEDKYSYKFNNFRGSDISCKSKNKEEFNDLM